MTSTETSAENDPLAPALPRFAAGSARSLLLTLFGEFVYPSDAPTWTSTLLHAFGGVGVNDKAGRQALMRAAAEGWIEGQREGRRTSWRLTPVSRRMVAEGSRRVRSLRVAAADWDGRWIALHISLTDGQRAERQRLYRALGWLGFGSPAPGLWICPDPSRAETVRAKLDQLGLSQQTLAMQAQALDFGAAEREWVARAWDLDAIASTYENLVARFSAMRPRSDEATFFAHIELVNALQRLPAIDPGLPAALLPPQWPAIRAAQRLDERRAKWRDVAHAYWAALSEAP
ncbi:MAG TPA: PaaX family transcriptional regulator C-terminal domain-containing protein [Ramlibacter sp.]|nr:PaaX family transcriptional regulator C-terminal domain-containing protein [Ramlibacter sp.]